MVRLVSIESIPYFSRIKARCRTNFIDAVQGEYVLIAGGVAIRDIYSLRSMDSNRLVGDKCWSQGEYAGDNAVLCSNTAELVVFGDV